MNAAKTSGISKSRALPSIQAAAIQSPLVELANTGMTTVIQMTARSSRSVIPIITRPYALLIPHPIDQDTIDAALRANDLTNNANFGMLRTLGCVYAAAGKTNQSRELLLKAMDSLYLNEPNSDVWFGLGLIAEQYGEFAAAEQMFERVERPDLATPWNSVRLGLAASSSVGHPCKRFSTNRHPLTRQQPSLRSRIPNCRLIKSPPIQHSLRVGGEDIFSISAKRLMASRMT